MCFEYQPEEGLELYELISHLPGRCVGAVAARPPACSLAMLRWLAFTDSRVLPSLFTLCRQEQQLPDARAGAARQEHLRA